MDRPRERARDHVGHRGEAAGEEALHVGRAAAVEAALARGQSEGIGRPILSIDRNDVGMAGQDVARRRGGPDRRPQVGLGPGRVEHAFVGNPEPVEISLDPRDQRQIGIAAGGVEADQRC